MSDISHRLRGVTRLPRCKTNPFKAQIALAGVTYHLGVFPDTTEAAKAYDNAAYWCSLEGARTTGLNFPDDYAKDYTPPPTDLTRAIQAKHRALIENRKPMPDTERVAAHQLLTACDALATAAAKLRSALLLAQANEAPAEVVETPEAKLARQQAEFNAARIAEGLEPFNFNP